MQHYGNHTRFHPLYHFVAGLSVALLVVLSVVFFVSHGLMGEELLLSVLVLLTAIILLLIFFIVRAYPLKVQDRAIRAEENLRHFVLTGKLLDPRLTVKQIVALRFAADGEFPSLSAKAASENLAPAAIKRAVRDWRADEYRI